MFAELPAAHATTIPVFIDLNFCNPSIKLSVGSPSVIINTNGFQSPFVLLDPFSSSFSIHSETKRKAPPKAVQPDAYTSGIFTEEISVKGKI